MATTPVIRARRPLVQGLYKASFVFRPIFGLTHDNLHAASYHHVRTDLASDLVPDAASSLSCSKFEMESRL